LSDLENHSKLERRPSKRLTEDSEGERNRIYLLTTEYAKDTLRGSKDTPKVTSESVTKVPSEPIRAKSSDLPLKLIETDSKENIKSILKKSKKESKESNIKDKKLKTSDGEGESPRKGSYIMKTPTEETTPKKEKEKVTDTPNLENSNEKDEKKEQFMFHLLLAIRTSIIEAKKADSKDDKEIEQDKKFKLATGGSTTTSQLKDFSPKIFSTLRKIWQVNSDDLLFSWNNKKLDYKKSVGKSESLFIFSADKKFILKTINHSESKALRKIILDYHKFMSENVNSLLPKFFAHHRLKTQGKSIYYVILENIFYLKNVKNYMI